MNRIYSIYKKCQISFLGVPRMAHKLVVLLPFCVKVRGIGFSLSGKRLFTVCASGVGLLRAVGLSASAILLTKKTFISLSPQ
jgi:hypothetical protein